MHFLWRERDSTENLCAAGEFNSSSSTNNRHVQKLKSWSKMAPAIGDLDVHAKLCVNKGEDWQRYWETFEPSYTVWYDGRISKAIRIKLKNLKNEFNESFMEESPLPYELFHPTHQWMEVIMKSLASHYL